MKNRSAYLLIVLAIGSLSSCKKKENITTSARTILVEAQLDGQDFISLYVDSSHFTPYIFIEGYSNTLPYIIGIAQPINGSKGIHRLDTATDYGVYISRNDSISDSYVIKRGFIEISQTAGRYEGSFEGTAYNLSNPGDSMAVKNGRYSYR